MSNIVKKIEHTWSIICSMSATDQETKNISLFNLIETINISDPENIKSENDTYKIRLPFELITRLRKKNPELGEIPIVFKVSAVSSDGKNTSELWQKDLVFPKQWSNVRFRTKVFNLEVKDQGLHYIEIKIKEPEEKQFVSIAKIPIEIKFSN